MAKKGTIGAGVALDGEKEFKNAIAGINKDLAVLGSEMKKNTDIFGKNEKSQESLKAISDTLEKQMKTQTDKVDTLSNALENAKKEYGENSNQVKNWQIALNRAEGELGKTKNQMEDATRELKDFGTETDKATRDVKELDGATDKAGGKMGGFMKGAGGAAATAAAAAAAVAAAIGKAIAVGARLTSEAIERADMFGTQAEIYGMDAETYQALNYAAAKLDVDIEMITSAQTKLTKAIYSASQGAKQQSEAFEKLKVPIKDVNGNLRGTDDIMADVLEALKNTKNETERNALAMVIMGKSAMDLNPLINAGAGELKNLTEEARNTGAVMSNETTAGLDAIGETIDGLKLTFQGLTGSLIGEFVPEFNTVFNQLSADIAAANGDWSLIAPAIETAMSDAVDILEDNEEDIRIVLEGLVDISAQVLSDSAPIFIDTGKVLGKALIKGLFTGWLEDWGLTWDQIKNGEAIIPKAIEYGLNKSESAEWLVKKFTGKDVDLTPNSKTSNNKNVVINQTNNFTGTNNREIATVANKLNRDLGLAF